MSLALKRSVPPPPAKKPRAAKMVAPPRIAIQAARLQRLRPEAAVVVGEVIDKLLAEVMPPGER